MASNKLFEAAADILAGSKKSASAMPPEKLPAEVHDAGGPTPENYKNDDNSAKITHRQRVLQHQLQSHLMLLPKWKKSKLKVKLLLKTN